MSGSFLDNSVCFCLVFRSNLTGTKKSRFSTASLAKELTRLLLVCLLSKGKQDGWKWQSLWIENKLPSTLWVSLRSLLIMGSYPPQILWSAHVGSLDQMLWTCNWIPLYLLTRGDDRRVWKNGRRGWFFSIGHKERRDLRIIHEFRPKIPT